jgi:glycosyltransferase involved in cell wall biosynthesis
LAPCRVSVIVPTLNRCRLLDQALSSIRTVRASDFDLDVIVIDNGSDDETESVARSHGARIFRSLELGASAARNAGLKAATGEYIAFLDDDDLWLPTHLHGQISLMQARPELDAAIGQIVLVNEYAEPISHSYPGYLPEDGRLFNSFLRDQVQLGTFVVKASACANVGAFDARLEAGEDWDWYLRLALRHRIGFVPTPCLLFKQRPAGCAEEDTYQLRQAAYCRKVFWRNVKRAGAQRPRAATVARLWIRHQGRYASYFVSSAARHMARGDRNASRHALMLGFRTSPPHVLRAVASRPSIRSLVATLLP